MWEDLKNVTEYLQDMQLADVSAAATPVPSDAPQVTPSQTEMLVTLNQKKLIAMLESTQKARQEVASVAEDSSVAEQSFSEPPVTKDPSPSDSGSSSKLSTPYLRDVLRQQSNAAKDAANKRRFFEAKK